MKERPVVFSGPMVRAILNGSKTQARYAMHPQPEHVWGWGVKLGEHDFTAHVRYPGEHPPDPWVRCPYGAPPHRECPGDRLWVREGFAYRVLGGAVVYRADEEDEHWAGVWISPIHMPRRASRLTLEIVSVRVERLQDITEEGAKAEGIHVSSGHMYRPLGSKEPMQPYTHRQAFAALWDELNHKRGYGWDSSPFVWVIAFRPLPPHGREGT